MIIREYPLHFTCIEQHHHAYLSKQIISHWKDYFLNNDPFTPCVLYAIEQHDVGWDYFDREPIWNDKAKRPYSFIDLPLRIKTVLYTNGVNVVEERNPYAAALCSAHYTKFLNKYDIPEVQRYIDQEQLRQQRILQSFPEIDEATFNKHLSILQLADNLSLFICLHEPGNNEKRHRYFSKGIPISKEIDHQNIGLIEPFWQDEKTIKLKNLPSIDSFSVTIKEKTVTKKLIEENGFLPCYEEAAVSKRVIYFA